ncbi:UNVERIFIED_CONTAM: hypothetical protein NY603_30935, partial [Bacteroidetes bacterium 56_B9]
TAAAGTAPKYAVLGFAKKVGQVDRMLRWLFCRCLFTLCFYSPAEICDSPDRQEIGGSQYAGPQAVGVVVTALNMDTSTHLALEFAMS